MLAPSFFPPFLPFEILSFFLRIQQQVSAIAKTKTPTLVLIEPCTKGTKNIPKSHVVEVVRVSGLLGGGDTHTSWTKLLHKP